MGIREFVQAIPKVDLNLQLTGALVNDSLLMIARQNGVPATVDDFDNWVALLEAPDNDRLDEIAAAAGSWVMYPEDIARVVYDVGVSLHKQNIGYAEICVAPSRFLANGKMNIDVFINALNDGRDRALRAWGVDMAWIFCIPVDNPRAGDDVARWVTGASARNGNVVALGMLGRDDAQPVGQFKRAYATARKKEVRTVSNAGSDLGPAGIAEALEVLNPHRLTDSLGIAQDESALQSIRNLEIPLIVSLGRAMRTRKVKTLSNFPLRDLLESGVQVALSADMPSLYQSTLIDEYVWAHEKCGLTVDEITELARQSVRLSFLDDDRKSDMLQRLEDGLPFAKASL